MGLGGLGSPATLQLAAAGVGSLTLLDSDRIDPSNLQRQVLYRTGDIGRWKTEAAAERLLRTPTGDSRGPDAERTASDSGPLPPARPILRPLRMRLDSSNVEAIVAGQDAVLEGSDNFETKFLVNDACVAAGIPLVLGGILRYAGQVLVVLPAVQGGTGLGDPDGPTCCYRCLFETPPPPGDVPSCEEAGVLGAVAGVVGSRQAALVLSILRGEAAGHGNRVLLFDALAATARTVPLRPRPGCPACARAPRGGRV